MASLFLYHYHQALPIAAIWLLVEAATSGVQGALNFKIFADPKSVVIKEQSRSCSSAVRCNPVDVDALKDKEDMLKAQDNEDYCLLKHYFSGVCEGTYLEVGAGDGSE